MGDPDLTYPHNSRDPEPIEAKINLLRGQEKTMLGDASPSELLNGIPVKEKGFFNASDGTPIFYEVSGGKGKTLLFCYGLVCRREHWHYQLKHFAEDYQLVTFDYRGHHRSGIPKNDQNLTLSRCVQDTLELMNYLKLKEVVAFGHSLGVPVATELAFRDPKRVKGAVLICGCVSNPFQGMFYTNYMDKVFDFSAKLFNMSPRWTSEIWNRFTDINPISVFMTSRLGFNPSLSEERDVHLYMDGVKQIPFRVFYRLLSDYRNYGKCKLPITSF
jgi:pimeloyl-ACP methyl ester carboxylesterase